MELLIVIPALNEEASIESIIERSLAARQYICANSPVTKVEITVVSDGSTDRTVELASRYTNNIQLTVFEQNRGYGAAIQAAWQESDADLLGFLDADGTCDPKFFANLCDSLIEERADLVLGCRLNKNTKMPLVRQIGNFYFAALLTAFSNRRVRDTASGMRVIRREAYQRLCPLPNGLHFTPAMSARAMLGAGGGTKLIEIDMPYHEREGVSKLNIVKDGFRFLRIITETAFLYKPGRILSQIATVFLLIGLIIAIDFSTHRTANWPTTQPVLGAVAFLFALLLFSAASSMQEIVDLTIGERGKSVSFSNWVHKQYVSRPFWIVPFLLILSSWAYIPGNFLASAAKSTPEQHLSQELWAGLLFLTAMVLVLGRILAYFVDLLIRQVKYNRQTAASVKYRMPDRFELTISPK